MTPEIKKALDLALEALRSASAELYRASSYCNTYEVLGNTNDAITAIQQALAAPTVQKPVAWMAESKNGNVRFTNIGQSADQLESFGWTISPLYAAPFQRQPLTEETVLECWKQVYEPGRREHDNATRMARAIEAAHGITEKGQP